VSAADRHADAGAATGAQVLSIARWVDIGRELGGVQDLSNHQALDEREVLTHHAHERTIRVAHVVDACFVQVQEAVVTSRVRDHHFTSRALPLPLSSILHGPQNERSAAVSVAEQSVNPPTSSCSRSERRILIRHETSSFSGKENFERVGGTGQSDTTAGDREVESHVLMLCR